MFVARRSRKSRGIDRIEGLLSIGCRQGWLHIRVKHY